jgi:TrmH family RNA methyltransferase
MHISKNKIKQISALKLKKNREAENLFVVEGEKIVEELLKTNYDIECIAATIEWLSQNIKKINNKNIEVFEISESELERISSLKTPNKVLAVVKNKVNLISETDIQSSLSLVLDDVQDPGNLGTIIRLADWFGIKNIFCSPETVELYNPKTLQSTMGSFLRVKVHYVDLEILLSKYQTKNLPIYGSFLDGENIYKSALPWNGFIVMGNESKGISKKIWPYITKRITIPGNSINTEGPESLNVSIATAVICSEFTRQRLQ